jgi:hypothetical protein
MKKTKWQSLALIMLGSFSLMNPLAATVTSDAKNELHQYFEKMPWLGLIADEVSYGPIVISHVHIHDGDKLAIAAPGEVLNGSLKYQIKSEDLKALHRYHLVIGIKGEGAQECVAHNMGLWDSKGKSHFKITAPQTAGVYEVRFLFVEDATCSAAQNEWNSGKSKPDSNATVGIIIVE